MPSGWKYTSLYSLLLTSTAYAAIGPRAHLTITNANISPDGFARNATVVNGASPGPVITAKKGEIFNLNVINKLSDPGQERGTSIHWHGLFQHRTSFMDGAAGVTQCPIAPQKSFKYSFRADRAGTFWYHSHFGLQYCDGLRGAMVIYDQNDPLKFLYDVDDESTIITLSEWYHTPAASIRTIPQADSTLINGKGRYPGGPATDLSVVNVQQGKRYRLRLISISCDPSFTFSIDGHDLQIIEVDGAEVRPTTVSSVKIFTGQRYSIVLNANQNVGNYWIRSLPNSGNGILPKSFDGGINSAILRYNGAPKAEPKSIQQPDTTPLAETDLHPLFNPSAPGKPWPEGADHLVNLTFGFDLNARKFSVNGVTYEPPTVPVLLQILSGKQNAHDLLPSGSVITVPKGKVMQVNVPGGLIGGPHPFHMHGHEFSVVRIAGADGFNFVDPVRRDVTTTGKTEGDFFAIRFTTDNPGPWILHCHIDFHLQAGLAIVFAEAPDKTPAVNSPVPAAWKDLCPTWDALPDDVKHPHTG